MIATPRFRSSYSSPPNPSQKGTLMFRPLQRNVGIAAVALLALTGCTTSAAPVSSAECPDAPLRSIALIDVTSSSLSGIGDYETAISRVTQRTAVCSGDLWVATFGESSGQTVTLLEQSFQVEAPTENAKRRKREQLAEEVAPTVRDKLSDAASRTPASTHPPPRNSCRGWSSKT